MLECLNKKFCKEYWSPRKEPSIPLVWQTIPLIKSKNLSLKKNCSHLNIGLSTQWIIQQLLNFQEKTSLNFWLTTKFHLKDSIFWSSFKKLKNQKKVLKNKRNKVKSKKLIFSEWKQKNKLIFQDGISKSSSNQGLLIIMMFQDATSWDPGLILFGKKFKYSLIN